MLERVKALFSAIESEQIPLSYACMTFLAAVMLRTFWEHTLLVRDNFSTVWGIDHSHYLFFYISLALTLILILHGVTGEKVARISRVVLPGFILLNIVPLVDRVTGASALFHVTYYFPEQHPDIVRHFISFFGDLEKTGATPGMRVEVAGILVLSGLYIAAKTGKLIHTMVGPTLVYVAIFFYIASPFFINAFARMFNADIEIGITVVVRLYLFLIFPLGMAVFYRARPDVFRAVAGDLRWMRLMHYLLFLILGACVFAKWFNGFVVFGEEGFFRMFFLAFSVTLAWAFCVISNNWADEVIDRISNPGRPSVTGIVPPQLYRRIGWGCLAGACIYALAVNAATLEVMAVFIGMYFFYSMPPVRLKRLPVLSKFVIGFNSLLMFMLGHMFWTESTTVQLPVIFFFLLFMTLSANFIDIKDHDGDRAAGIKTLPVLLGPVWAKRLIGLSFIPTYLMAYEAFMLTGCFWLCLGAGVVQCWFINRKDYDEKPVLLLHAASLVFVIIYTYFTTGPRL